MVDIFPGGKVIPLGFHTPQLVSINSWLVSISSTFMSSWHALISVCKMKWFVLFP
jgi:hypothetical protein